MKRPLVRKQQTSSFYNPHIKSLSPFVLNSLHVRGIEWSLRAFASTRALRIFLRARAVIKFVFRAASTLENTTGEQQILR